MVAPPSTDLSLTGTAQVSSSDCYDVAVDYCLRLVELKWRIYGDMKCEIYSYSRHDGVGHSKLYLNLFDSHPPFPTNHHHHLRSFTPSLTHDHYCGTTTMCAQRHRDSKSPTPHPLPQLTTATSTTSTYSCKAPRPCTKMTSPPGEPPPLPTSPSS